MSPLHCVADGDARLGRPAVSLENAMSLTQPPEERQPRLMEPDDLPPTSEQQ